MAGNDRYRIVYTEFKSEKGRDVHRVTNWESRNSVREKVQKMMERDSGLKVVRIEKIIDVTESFVLDGE